jgi:hypothetical protein
MGWATFWAIFSQIHLVTWSPRKDGDACQKNVTGAGFFENTNLQFKSEENLL